MHIYKIAYSIVFFIVFLIILPQFTSANSNIHGNASKQIMLTPQVNTDKKLDSVILKTEADGNLQTIEITDSRPANSKNSRPK